MQTYWRLLTSPNRMMCGAHATNRDKSLMTDAIGLRPQTLWRGVVSRQPVEPLWHLPRVAPKPPLQCNVPWRAAHPTFLAPKTALRDRVPANRCVNGAMGRATARRPVSPSMSAPLQMMHRRSGCHSRGKSPREGRPQMVHQKLHCARRRGTPGTNRVN